MTITYPRTMPEVGANSISFEPQQIDYMSPENSGRIGAVAAGFPLWRMKVSLTNMAEADSDEWRAFIASLRGSRRIFYARDLSRPYPRLHSDGRPSGPAPSSWSQAITSDGDALLTLNGMLPNVVLSRGDYVGFRWDAAGAAAGSLGRRALVRAVERGIVGADGSVTLTVEPPVPTIVPPGAAAYIDHASCLMRIVSSSTQLGVQVPGGYTPSGGVIEAVQDLLP